ncbi:PREDICTED: protein CHUP1, chloroplastic-like [Populus euphratica]|uniref:Protein CHUP1, chloroplastic-like n=1 Tax=Populus euphratica TaxID=75702 RepID=A0AAJ6X312_POPEU|nr:PREDICTED: protein CHUP1, chloroplastic-like [Populus euphratica]
MRLQSSSVIISMKAERESKMRKEEDESLIIYLKKEVEAALLRTDYLEKENQELQQEVIRLKAQISSLKAHDNERKSMLWKKLQNPIDSSKTDVFLQKQSDFVKVSEEHSSTRPSIQELPPRKEKLAKVPNPPPRPTSVAPPSPKEVNSNKLSPAPPPPPPPPKMSVGSKTVRRVPEVAEFYRLLTRRDAHMENRINSAAISVVAFTPSMIGEIENRSTYLSAIKSDVEKQKDFINFLIKEVESAAFKEISDVKAFVKWLDDELSSLVDERAVLKHFPQWPERKADALREAAFNYRDLINLESEVSSFQDNTKEPLIQALGRMQALQDRLERSVNNTERTRESMIKRYRDHQIPWEWLLNTGLIGQMKLSSLRLAKDYLKRITKELQLNECSGEENLLLQGARFAYRVHQFAGGFDAETMHAFQELKKIGMGRLKQ